MCIFTSAHSDKSVPRVRAAMHAAVQKFGEALRASASSNPTSVVSHVVCGAAVGVVAWAITSAIDPKVNAVTATAALGVRDPPIHLNHAPELLGVFIELRAHVVVNDGAVDLEDSRRACFEEAVRQADALVGLSHGVALGRTRATPADVAAASGYSRRALASIRELRDTHVSTGRINAINRMLLRAMELCHAHVTNMRSASIAP